MFSNSDGPGIAPEGLNNEQLELARALCQRQLALWSRAEMNESTEIVPAAIETSVSE